MKNICFLEGDISRRGGTEKMTSTLANALKEDYNVYIFSLKLENKLFYHISENVKIVNISENINKFNFLKIIFNIRKFLRKFHVDCVINVDIGMGIYGILSTLLTDIYTITWEHSNFYNNWNSKYFPLLRKFAAKFSDALVVLTNRDKENYLRNLKIKIPIVVIPNPLLNKNDIDTSYDKNSRKIISAGMLLPIKGYDLCIKVAKKVLNKNTNWKWCICGGGPLKEELQQMIYKEKLENQMFLKGSIPNMDLEYKDSAIFVLTSRMEGLPMVLLEAKAWKLPIVSFDIMTGPSDLIINGENGYLIEPFDVDAMANKINYLISNEEVRYEFSINSQLGMEDYEKDVILQKWKKILG